MKRYALVLLCALSIIPTLSPLALAQVPTVASTTTNAINTYAAASEISVREPVPADLITAGATVDVQALVRGDILAAAGAVTIADGAGGDVRVAGGRVRVDGVVGGDVAAAGGSVEIAGTAHNIYAAGASVVLSGASTGDVAVYGSNVTLSGTYTGNVTINARDDFTIAPNTRINGSLRYTAPNEVRIASSTVVTGGVRYNGAYAYVPRSTEASQYAVVGAVLFIAVRLLASMIVAGLLAGIFPGVAARVTNTITSKGSLETISLFGIGVAVAVLVPLLSLFLLLSFVGAELAILVLLLYMVLGMVAYVSVGIVTGYLLRAHVLYKLDGSTTATWRDAVLGTVAVQLLLYIPVLGVVLVLLATLVSAGTLVRIAYEEIYAYHVRNAAAKHSSP